MNRTTFYGSPAYVTHNSLTLQPRGNGFEISNEIGTVDVADALRGKIGEREDIVRATAKLSPHALRSILSSQFTKFFAYQPADIGKLLFPGTDKPFVVQTKNGGTGDAGQAITYSAAMVSQPPQLQFAPLKPLFGDVEFTMLKKNNTAGTDAAAFVAVADSSYTEPVLDPSDILDTTYLVQLGETFTGIETDEEGVKVAIKYTWQDQKNATDGLLNFRLANVECEIRFRPINMDAANIHNSLLLQDGASAGRGKLLSGRGMAFVVQGPVVGDPVFYCDNVVAIQTPTVFSDQSRSGEVLLKAQRGYSAGLLPLFALSVFED